MFWLLGAIDGHGKNFSIFLRPGGRFRLTPLYDVMSVQPIIDARQLRKNQVKLAVSVGDSKHYILTEVMPRHFVQTAAKSGLAASLVQSVFDEILETKSAAVEKALNELPSGFTNELANSIVKGLHARAPAGTVRSLAAAQNFAYDYKNPSPRTATGHCVQTFL